MEKDIGLLSLGHALLDSLTRVGDEFLLGHGLEKGRMEMVKPERAQMLRATMPEPELVMAGGSVANSVACFVSCGGTGAFMGKVGDDDHGAAFADSMREHGVIYKATPHPEAITSMCSVMITPDSERTMATCLGASALFGEDDVDESLIARAQIMLVEGYLFDHPRALPAIYKAANIAEQNGTKIAFTPSDVGCIERHYPSFVAFLSRPIYLLGANEGEIKALARRDDFNAAAFLLGQQCDNVSATRGARGALMIQDGAGYHIPPRAVRVVDVTGAGDAFLGAVAYGLSRRFHPRACGALAADAAAHTVSHVGARNPDIKFSRTIVSKYCR